MIKKNLFIILLLSLSGIFSCKQHPLDSGSVFPFGIMEEAIIEMGEQKKSLLL
jgi:hypothetical protein